MFGLILENILGGCWLEAYIFIMVRRSCVVLRAISPLSGHLNVRFAKVSSPGKLLIQHYEKGPKALWHIEMIKNTNFSLLKLYI